MPASPAKQRIVRCPQCGGESLWSADNKFRPFCSERCKLIDFGEWASERNTIPGESVLPEEDEDE